MKPNSALYSKRVLACISAFLGLTIFTLYGATITWTNTSGGVWSSPVNWSPNIVPRSSDTVQITTAGTYTVTVDTNVGILGLTLGGASGVQTLTNNTQIIGITNSWLVGTNGILNLGGGSLSGGPLTLQGTFNWFGATVLSPVTVSANGVLNFAGSASYLEGPLTNSGTINWNGGSLSLYNNHSTYNGIINNQPSGLFNIQSDQNCSAAGLGFEAFLNAGLVRKIAGAGVTTFSVAFTNSGTVDAESGAIHFGSGGNLGGAYHTASGAVIEFDSGNFTQNGTVTVTGSGLCRLNGATATLQSRITQFVLAAGTVFLASNFETNGTIQSLQLDGAFLSGTNVVTGTLGIDGGGLAQVSALTVASGGVLNFNGAPVYLYAPLTNSGTINWSGSSLSVYNNNTTYTGIINNRPSGLFSIQSDQNCSSAGLGFESFINAGTVRKTAGLGTTTFGIVFTNSGTVDAESGAIHFTGGGNLGGAYNTASGAIIEFDTGSFVHTGPVAVSGSGLCRQNGATVTLNDRIANFLLASGNVVLTPTFETNGTIQNLQLDGAFLAGTNVVTGTLGIDGGGLAQVSALTVASGGVLNFNGASVYLYAPLTNSGTINWTGSSLNIYNNNTTYTGIINNRPSGLFSIQSDQNCSSAGLGNESFVNAGTVRKTAGLGTTTFGIVFTNSGTVDAESGAIHFTGSGNLGGTYNTASGAIIEFDTGSFTETGTVNISGSGLCRQNGATVILNDRIANFLLSSGNVVLTPTFETNGTIQSLQLDGATLTGTNVVTGTLGIDGGGLGSASPLTVSASGVLNFNGGSAYIYAPLTNSGTINWSGGTLSVYNNANAYTGIINNQPSGLFNIECDQNLSTAALGFEAFVNTGTVRKTAGLGTTTCNVPFTNDGTLDAQSGIIQFTGPYAQTGGAMNFGITSLAYYGKIAFSANAPLTGTLSVNFNGGYFPSVGDSFPLVSYSTRGGIFTNLALPAAATWQTNYSASTFTLSVLSVNTGAGSVTLSPIANQTINAGVTLLVTNAATDSNPGNQIAYSLSVFPTGATIGSTSGILQWRAPVARAGTVNAFTVVATDNGVPPASDSKSFSVTVNPLAPVILTPVSYVSNRFTLQISGTVGPDYALSASTNLTSWTSLFTNTPAAMPFIVTVTNAGAFPHRYYRAVLGP
ncbi:MAG TPA: hypothetical protein VG077_16865 [Verrucomicrobiae bacterium]|nr:hypothetical protein [Verrucomicrobiae bacterium]